MGVHMKQLNIKSSAIKWLVLGSFLSASLTVAPATAQSGFLSKFREYREKFQGVHKDEKTKRLSEIDSEIEKAKDPEDQKLLLMAKALIAMDLGQNETALALFDQLLKEKNNLHEYVHYYYGQLLAQSKQFPQAKVHYEKIMDLSPNVQMQIEAQYQLARISLEEKNFKMASRLLRKLERRQRNQEGYRDTVYSLAQAERGLGLKGSYCKWVKKLYTKFPQYPKIEKWGPNLAKDEFEGQPTGCAVSHEDRRSRIKSLQWAGLNEKALGEIRTLREQSAKSDKYEIDRLEAGYWLHDGEAQKALELLLPYGEIRKKDPNHLSLVANISARAGESQAAVNSYYSAYKLAPRGKFGKQALYQAAFMSYQFKDYDGAAQKFREFMKAYPKSGLSRDAKWHLAWIRYLKGDYEGAHSSLSALLKESSRRRRGWKSFPKDRVNYWMAMSLYRMEKYDKARLIFQSLAKDQLISYYSIAAHYRLQKLEKLSPKSATLQFLETSRRITRFLAFDSMIPPEDIPVTGEENESEETLAANTLETEGDSPASSEESASPEDPAATTESEVAGVQEETKSPFASPALVQRLERARDLMILGLNDWARWDLYDIERKTSNRQYLKNLMQEYHSFENYNRSSYIAEVYFGGQRALHGLDGVRYLWEYAYPKAYVPSVTKYAKEWDIPSELIWGIMRAESRYKKDVVSPVGALGLMQVMPGTGMRISQMMKEKNFEPRSLLEPETAIKVGSRYLQRLDKKFEKKVPLVAAAYNAGPHRVRSWLATFGSLEMDEFIEHIPFLETRNYVKKVVSNVQVYSLLYGNKKDSLSYLSEALTIRMPEKFATKETWEEI